MAMRIIGLDRLNDFLGTYAECKSWLDNWIRDVRGSTWRKPQDIKDRYASASFLADRIVIFNVKGNGFRMETQIAYGAQTVVVKWIGPHSDYDQRNKDR